MDLFGIDAESLVSAMICGQDDLGMNSCSMNPEDAGQQKIEINHHSEASIGPELLGVRRPRMKALHHLPDRCGELARSDPQPGSDLFNWIRWIVSPTSTRKN